jgi:methionyl-tRNA formyltransferase
MTLRLAFMGTPDFAVPTLSELLAQGHEVAAVYTQPPRPAGRGKQPRPSPVQRFAETHGLEVRAPQSLRDEAEQARFAALDLDVAVVVAYGLILPRPILEAPRLGCLNLHASLLPRWRGAAPIQRAIMAGDTETGIMVMRMEEGLDTGPILLAERVAIGLDETAGALHDRLAGIGATLMTRALAALERDALEATPQPADGVTYARKITNEETRIDWSRPAREVHNHIRGLSPVPGAWFEVADSKGGRERVRVLKAALAEGNGTPGTVLDDALTVACGAGAVRLVTLQRAGRAAMEAGAFLRGFALPAGARLG